MNRKVLRLFLFFVSFFFVVLLLPTSAHALNSPNKISTSSNSALAPTITADSNGKIHMVWMDAPNSWGSPTISLLYSFWNGASWSTPTTVASGEYHWLPSLAADSSGNAYLTWGNNNTGQILYASYNGTSWSAAQVISNSSDGSAWDSEIAIDSSGKPHVTYTVLPPGAINDQRSIYHTRWTGTAWTTPVNLSAGGAADQFPTISATSNGNVHVVWKSQLDGTVIAGASRIVHQVWNGTSWSTTNVVSATIPTGQQPQPRITVDKDNNAHVVWEECTSTINNCWDEAGPTKVMYSKWNGTSWSTPFTVTTSSQMTLEQIPSVGVVAESTNNMYVGWIEQSTSPLKVGFRKYNNATAVWETAQTNNTSVSSADFPAYTIDKWDNVHITWGEVNSTTKKYELFYDVVPIAAKIIGSTGGTLTNTNGDKLTISSGSLSTNTTISMQIAPLSQTAPIGSNTLSRQYIFEPSGTVFVPPAEVVFSYTDAEVAGINENTLGIYVWDSVLNQWVFKTGTINKAKNTITVSLDHFSIYSIFGAQNGVSWISPLQDNTASEFNVGRTVPIKFKFDTPVDVPNQVNVQVVNSSGILLSEFVFGDGSNNIRYDPETQEYITNFDSTKDTLLGIYQSKVLYQGLLRGSVDFTLQ